ncbi:hypothetical protein GQ44DRAFT_671522 [Phaeosphaeriaceae sp. PMI808]|nr:hypothetical protein GQ44DRAFT_671522 [Phaeosphaeriaceae sp. PMI808]
MRSVCIIGAGPAGLVAAKTFLQAGIYSVTVFEAADDVGGMWKGVPGDYGDKCSPYMRTNLSRFTVAFSDLSWSNVPLRDPLTGLSLCNNPPMFPMAWHVGQYLRAYAEKFNLIPNIIYNKRVTSAKGFEDFQRWEIICVDTITMIVSTHNFDYLVVASGFFNQPSSSFNPFTSTSSLSIQHSSQFRELSSLTKKAGKVVVIGGSISGSEAAAQAAMQISDAKFAPNLPSCKPLHSKSTIYHIINRPFYCLPRYVPDFHSQHNRGTSRAPSFLPLDLVLYDLTRRREVEITASIGTVPEEKARKGHDFVRSIIGGDHSEVGQSALVYNSDQTQFPAYTGITDSYSEFVRSGVIIPVQGWVDKVEGDENGDFAITVIPKEPWAELSSTDVNRIITEVVGIIEATGYKTDLGFFDDDVMSLLEHDPTCPRIPILLSRGSILPTKLPTLGFVGFYEGPFWSVMEVQARFIVHTWSLGYSCPYSHIDAEKMRSSLKITPISVPQFWMNDYVGFVEEFARSTGIERNDTTLGAGKGPVFAARYADRNADSDPEGVNKEVTAILKASALKSSFVAAAVFRGMQGVKTFTGTAHFHIRHPTCPTYSAEYLYIEEGVMGGVGCVSAMPFTHRYTYRYNEWKDEITVWLVRDHVGTAGEPFFTWYFYRGSEITKNDIPGWMASGYESSGQHQRQNNCEFSFIATRLENFCFGRYSKGPNTDFRQHSWYERPEVGSR